MLEEKRALNIAEKSDEELVNLALKNRDDFLYLVDRYKNRLTAYIRRLTKASPEDAEDILQEIFIKVYLNLNEFDRDLKFSSWIYRITHNQVISRHRRLKARPEGYAVDIDDAAARRLASDIDIAASADLTILKENILKILDHLAPKFREVLVLRFLEEKSYEEIADIIKKPAGTVASTISKAKLEFRQELKRSGVKFHD
ncbi:MAG: RNA polymerase sigma factor [Patescibacteria group bacterium]